MGAATAVLIVFFECATLLNCFHKSDSWTVVLIIVRVAGKVFGSLHLPTSHPVCLDALE